MPFMEYYGAERSNRVDAHLTTLMDLINIMPSNSIVLKKKKQNLIYDPIVFM